MNSEEALKEITKLKQQVSYWKLSFYKQVEASRRSKLDGYRGY